MPIITRLRPLALLLLLCSCLLPRIVGAQPVLSISGSGPYGGWVVIYNGQAYASSWTQTGRYTNVTITARLTSFGRTDQTGRAYLTTALGPGTTVSSQIAFTSFTFPLTLSEVTLFSGLTLEPGTYYLSMVGNSDSGSGWSTGCAAVMDAADGVSLGSDYGFSGLASYLPSSSVWTSSSIFTHFTVIAVTNSPASVGPIGSTHLNLRAYKLPDE